MIYRRLAIGFSAVLLAACSSSNSSSDDGPVPNGSFSVNAGSIGGFGCMAQTQVLMLSETALNIVCTSSDSSDATDPIALTIPAYHGSDTYSFTSTSADAGVSSADQPNFYAKIGVNYVGISSGDQGTPASTCTVTLTGPATLSKGSEVQGHVHCENMSSQPPEDPSGPYVSPVVGLTVEGDFDAFDPISI